MGADFSGLAVVIPTYNEKENIVPLAERIFHLYPGASVFVVDDNSPDGTAEAVKNAGDKFANIHVIERRGGRGFGGSYIDGLKAVLSGGGFDFVAMMDADFSHDPKEISAMLARLGGCEVVVGSRYVAGGGVENWSLRRRALSRFANFYVKAILGLPVGDATSGFICLKKSALEKVDLDAIRSDGYAFLVELKNALAAAGASVCEHPITFTERREGQSKMSAKNIFEAVLLPWKLR